MIIHLVVGILHVKVGHQSIGKVLIAVGHRVAAHVAPAPQAVYQAYAKWTYYDEIFCNDASSSFDKLPVSIRICKASI